MPGGISLSLCVGAWVGGGNLTINMRSCPPPRTPSALYGQTDFANDIVRRIVVSSGAVTTLAGGPTSGSADGIGAAASFFYPGGAAMDAAATIALVVRAKAGTHSP